MSDDKVQIDADRRKSERVELKSALKYSVITPSLESGLIKNISSKGLCLILNRILPEGSILRIEFQLPGEKPEQIEALVKIVWQRQEEGKFLAGAKFLS